jgi:hypothetical protein
MATDRTLKLCAACDPEPTFTWGADGLCLPHHFNQPHNLPRYPRWDNLRATQLTQDIVDFFGPLPDGAGSSSEVAASVVTIANSMIESAVIESSKHQLTMVDSLPLSEQDRNALAMSIAYELIEQLFPTPVAMDQATKDSIAQDLTSLSSTQLAISHGFAMVWELLRTSGGFDASVSSLVQDNLEAYLEFVANNLVIPQTKRVFGEMLYLNSLVVETVTGAPAKNQNRFDQAIVSVPAAYVEVEEAFQAEVEAKRLTILALERLAQEKATADHAAQQETALAQQRAHQEAYQAAVWAQQEAEQRAELTRQRVKKGFGIAGRLLKGAWDFEVEMKRERDLDRREREDEAHRRNVHENSKIINDRLRRQRGY